MDKNLEEAVRQMIRNEANSISPEMSSLQKVFNDQNQTRRFRSRWALSGVVTAVVVVLGAGFLLMPKGSESTNAAAESGSTTPPEELLTYSDVADKFYATQEEKTGEVFNNCLKREGASPEYLQLTDRQNEIIAEAKQSGLSPNNGDPLAHSPNNFGPTTNVEAEKNGFDTTVQPETTGPELKLHSSQQDLAIDEKCYKETGAAKTTGEDSIGAIKSDLIELSNNLSEQRSTSVGDLPLELLTERLECVAKNGYPEIEIDQIVKRGFREDGLVPGTDVQLGEEKTSTSYEPSEDAVTRLATRTREYVPTKTEVAFAKTFVVCGEKMDFANKLEAHNEEVIRSVLVDNQEELRALYERIEAL